MIRSLYVNITNYVNPSASQNDDIPKPKKQVTVKQTPHQAQLNDPVSTSKTADPLIPETPKTRNKRKNSIENDLTNGDMKRTRTSLRIASQKGINSKSIQGY